MDDERRCERLIAYLADRTVPCSLVEDGWLFALGRQSNLERYIDPNILKGLSWWSTSLTNSDVPFAVRQDRGFPLALCDCWTLLAWSRWLRSRAARKNILPNELVLVHVDDHDDLMSPRIVRQEMSWVDEITRQEFSLINPTSVSSAIESGAVGIGSFIVPLLCQVPLVHIRHLCATGYSTSRQGFYRLEQEDVRDALLAPGAIRQSVKLQSIPACELFGQGILTE